MWALKSMRRGVSDYYTYYLEKYTQICLRLSTVGSMILHVFRRPTWTYSPENSAWRDLGYYPSFGIAVVPDYIVYPLSLVLMMVTSISIHKILYNERISSKIPNSRKQILKNVTLPLVGAKLFLDGVQFIIYMYSNRRYVRLCVAYSLPCVC
jgi:hypothetical protein